MTPSTTLSKRIVRILIGIAIAAFWIGLWWLLAIKLDKVYALPTPDKVFEVLLELGGTKLFWQEVWGSFLRILNGFGLGTIAGVCLGAAAAAAPFIKRLFSPLIGVLRAAPIAAFTIVAMMWLKNDDLPVALSAAMVVPMMFSATYHAIGGIDKKLVEMSQVFGLSRGKIFLSVKLRSVLPHIISSAASSLGFAWKAGIAAEIICRPDYALGSRILDAKAMIDTPTVFAVTAVTVILSLILEALFKAAVRAADRQKGGALNADRY